MTISLYLDRDTWIHRLDARTKVLAVFALFILALLYTHPFYLFIVWSLVMLGVASAQAFTNIRKILILLVLLFLYSAVLWPFFVEGHTPVFHVASIPIMAEGLIFGIGMGIRLNIMVMSGILLLSTTKLEDFALSLQQFGIPPSMGFALSLAFRWVPTLLSSSRTIVQAQRSRGLDLSSGTVIDKIRGYTPLVVPLIGHTLRQTTLLAMALESKGFSPGRRRHVYTQSRMTVLDYVILLVAAVMVGVSWRLRVMGFGV
ncbi:MAG: cobalt ABC transporter permease [Nitrospirales bacterium]|nr:MAG: cobalt ABC transporter permease [Nitrospirales bacterium]